MYKNLYWKWENAITPELCEFFIGSINWDEAQEATVYGSESMDEKVIDPNIRSSSIVWQDPFSPIGSILQTRVALANRNAGWGIRIDAMEDVQVGRYTEGSFYDWHRDSGTPRDNGQIRKLSIVMALSDPDSYEGGDFEFEEDYLQLNRFGQGDIIVFPSYLRHRVTPVTAGVRYSAVGWCIGPTFI